MDSTFSALQYLGRDLKKSLDVNSSTDIDRELKELAGSVEIVRESLDRGKKAQEVIEINENFHRKQMSFLFRRTNHFANVLNVL